ncbi:MAG: hypothetical protein ACRD01_01160 [Terriglobales bacterium]
MRSVNLRQLRDTRQLKAWLRAGQTVELRERSVVLARIVPAQAPEPALTSLPDFAARARRIFGSARVPGSRTILQQRRGARY